MGYNYCVTAISLNFLICSNLHNRFLRTQYTVSNIKELHYADFTGQSDRFNNSHLNCNITTDPPTISANESGRFCNSHINRNLTAALPTVSASTCGWGIPCCISRSGTCRCFDQSPSCCNHQQDKPERKRKCEQGQEL